MLPGWSVAGLAGIGERHGKICVNDGGDDVRPCRVFGCLRTGKMFPVCGPPAPEYGVVVGHSQSALEVQRLFIIARFKAEEGRRNHVIATIN